MASGRSLGRRLLRFARELSSNEIWLRCAEGNDKAWYEREAFVLEKTETAPVHGQLMRYDRWRRTSRSTVD